jgi:hypothetical protein
MQVVVYGNATGGGQSFEVHIDGKGFGRTGSSGTDEPYITVNFTVPSGSTYKVIAHGGINSSWWHEAKMPVAIGTGGKTVTFRSGGVSAGQTAPPNTNYPIQFSTTADVNGGTWDGTYFTPDTAGWYQMSGSVFANAPTTSRVGCIIQKNDNSELATFNQGITAVGGGGVSTSGLVYCNGTTDKLSLVINCNDTLPTLSGSTNTVWFSAHLVSGGSSSGGDSIWTELGDVAIYDGDIQVNGVTVGQGSGTNDKNTALGISCLENTTGVQNTAVGFNSLIADTTGTRNTALGYASLNTLTEGEYNTAVGHVAGSSLITGNNNILIGHDAQPSAPDVNNEVTIGNASITGTRLRGNVYVENNTNTDIRALVPSGKYASLQVDNTDQKYSMQVRPDEGNAFVIRNETASQNTMSIATNGTVKFGTNMTIGNTGVISAQGINDTTTNAVAPNVCVDGSGVLRRSTVATYSAEEVDKKLAIKDKLIEKLSARLDELEKKVK